MSSPSNCDTIPTDASASCEVDDVAAASQINEEDWSSCIRTFVTIPKPWLYRITLRSLAASLMIDAQVYLVDDGRFYVFGSVLFVLARARDGGLGLVIDTSFPGVKRRDIICTLRKDSDTFEPRCYVKGESDVFIPLSSMHVCAIRRDVESGQCTATMLPIEDAYHALLSAVRCVPHDILSQQTNAFSRVLHHVARCMSVVLVSEAVLYQHASVRTAVLRDVTPLLHPSPPPHVPKGDSP